MKHHFTYWWTDINSKSISLTNTLVQLVNVSSSIIKHFARSNNLEGKKKTTNPHNTKNKTKPQKQTKNQPTKTVALQKSPGRRRALLYTLESNHYRLLKIPSVFLFVFLIQYFEGQCKLLTLTLRRSVSLLLKCVRETPTLKSSKYINQECGVGVWRNISPKKSAGTFPYTPPYLAVNKLCILVPP